MPELRGTLGVMSARFGFTVETGWAKPRGLGGLRRFMKTIPSTLCISGFLGAVLLLAAPLSADQPISVRTITPSSGTVSLSTSQPASVHPYQEADLAARVSGYVKSVAVDIGDEVKAGDVLAEIDAPEMGIQAERKQAEIQLLVSRKEQLEASVKSAEALLRAEVLEYERAEQLVKTGAVTKRVRDESQSRKESSEAELAVAQAEVKSAEAAQQVAVKEFEELRTMIGYAQLKAPFDGVVTFRDLDPGDLVKVADSSGGDGPLFQIAMVDTVRIRVAVPESDAVLVDAGDKAEFTCRALGGRVFEGEVARSSRSINPKSGTMRVEIDLKNADGNLISGMYGQATIQLERHDNVLTLPAAAVRFDETGSSASVDVVVDGKIKRVAVKTGIDDGAQIEITEGLSGGEQVVGSAVGRLAEGTEVTVLAAESAPAK